MSTIAVKLTSLAIRTLAKPIANSIKQQAKEHPRFRALCIGIAQAVHRTDMRIRLNLLRDNSVIEKAEAEEERRKEKEKEKEKESVTKLAKDALEKDGKSASVSASSTSSSTATAATTATTASTESSSHLTHKKKRSTTPHIRPLSDAKAIERGANFISEAFLFSVAGGLILYEALRSRKKEMNRRDEVAERLQQLEELDEIWRRKVDMLERSLDAAGIKKVAERQFEEPEELPPPEPEGILAKIRGLFSTSSSSSKAPDVPPQPVSAKSDAVAVAPTVSPKA
ncbi:hypothetical protein ABW19_dt0201759 [Dactylella cylindrospora]|nr:hypothetical protein ABW19_dt0201759 [Dactylella cylindrospora]